MRLPAGLSDIRNKRHITPAHLAGFIGVTVGTYWDIEIGLADDGLEILDVGQLLRLIIVLQAEKLLLSQVAADQRAPAEIASRFTDRVGNVDVCSHLRAAIAEQGGLAAEFGWEEGAVEQWLVSDAHLYAMPCSTLRDLCDALNFAVEDVFVTLLYALGVE